MASHTPKRAARTQRPAKPVVTITSTPHLTPEEREFLERYAEALKRGCGITVSIGNLTRQRAEELITTKLVKTPVVGGSTDSGSLTATGIANLRKSLGFIDDEDRLANLDHYASVFGTAAQNGGPVGAIPGAACGLGKATTPPLLEAIDRLGQLQSDLALLSQYAVDRLQPLLPAGYSDAPKAADSPAAPSADSPAVQRLQEIASFMSSYIDSSRSLLRNAQI